MRERVAPVLKEHIDGGKINLTAIVNTHQFVFPTGTIRNLLILWSVTGTTQAAIPRSYDNLSRPCMTLAHLNAQLSQFKGLSVIGGKDCDDVTRTPKHEETFKIGEGISVKALHTPCHTQDSICWLMEDGNERVVFTGDTLFIGGNAIAGLK